jgi:hypothetical protein
MAHPTITQKRRDRAYMKLFAAIESKLPGIASEPRGNEPPPYVDRLNRVLVALDAVGDYRPDVEAAALLRELAAENLQLKNELSDAYAEMAGYSNCWRQLESAYASP